MARTLRPPNNRPQAPSPRRARPQSDPAGWRELGEAYGQVLVRRGMSRSTIAVSMRAVRGFTGFLILRGCLRVDQFGKENLAAVWPWLSGRRVHWGHRQGLPWSPASVRSWTNTIRQFLRWVARSGQTLQDWSLWVPPVKVPRSLPRALRTDEVMHLLTAGSSKSPRDLRDHAVLELLYAAGLRVGELLGLDLADLDLREGEVQVRHGKGGRDRRVPIGDPAVRALRVYLESGRELLGARRVGGASPAVFLSVRGRRLQIPAAETMIRRRAQDAGLKGRITPHVLRHTAAVHLLRGGADIRHIAEFLGHASVGTTARYTRLSLADLRQALVRSHPRSRLGPLTDP